MQRTQTAHTTTSPRRRSPLDRLPTTLLGVWAHPDDEAYLSAGLMARMADAGHAVTVVTATRGEKGTDDPSRFGSAAFAAHRERELRTSLGELGVSDLRLLDLVDGDLDTVEPAAPVEAIAAVLREVRPEAVITFGPDGITGHPDHQAISAWTTEAWRRERQGELRYATQTHDFIRTYAELHADLGMFDGFGLDGPFSVAHDELVARYDLSETELDRKRRALAAHASQTEPLAGVMGEATYRTWQRVESFRLPTVAELSSCPLPTRNSGVPEAVAA